MKEWFSNLEPRERQALLIAAIVVTAVAVYLFGWQPFAKQYVRLEKSVKQQKVDLQWMRQAAGEVRALRARQTSHAGTTGQSLLAVVDDTARKAKLGEFIRRVEPQGTQHVQIWIENAPFDLVAAWLASLQASYGVNPSTVTVTRQNLPGTVNVHVMLEGAQS